MKKFLPCTLMLMLIFALFTGAAYAEGGISISCETVETENGYDIYVNASGLSNIAMMQFDLIYDPAVIECTEVSSGSAFNRNVAPSLNSSIPGRIKFAWVSLNPTSTDGTLLILHALLLGEEGEIGPDYDGKIYFADPSYVQPELEFTGCVISSAADVSKPSEEEKENSEFDGAAQEGINSGIDLPKNNLKIEAGESFTFDTTDSEDDILWSSSNESVARVSAEGQITARAHGSAVITAQTLDGTRFATCVVNVEGDLPEETENAALESVTDSKIEAVPSPVTEAVSKPDSAEESGKAALPKVLIPAAVVIIGVAVLFITRGKRNSSKDEN